MHVAVFLGPPREGADDAPPPSGALGLRLLRAGYKLVHVSLGDDLEAQIQSALASAKDGDALLFYVAGTMCLEDTHLRMRINGEAVPSLALAKVGNMLRLRAAKDTLLVLDVAHDEAEGDAMRASEYVQAAIQAFDARSHGLEMLVAAAGAAGPTSPPWAFTRLLADALDDPLTQDAAGVTSPARICALLRANGSLADHVAGFAHVKATKDFVILPATPRESWVPPEPDPKPTARSRSIPPASIPPTVGESAELLLELADETWKRQDWDEAFAAYKRALMVTPESDGHRAHIYMRLGEAKRRQRKPREAELNFEKVLEIDRRNRPALEALIALAEEAKDWRRALSLRKRAREALEDVSQLAPMADLLENRLGDAKSAIALLEEARALSPGDAEVLKSLRRLYEARERWKPLVQVLGELVATTSDPTERGALRFAQADVALGRLLDEESGLSWLEAVLEDDPSHEKALLALVAVRARRKELALLDKTYARLVDRFAASGNAERAWQTCKRLGLLRRDSLADAPGAADAFQGAVKIKPNDVESRAALADLCMTKGDLDAAQSELVLMSRLEPLRVATYRKLFDLHTRKGNTDRAWLAATALEDLGAADIDHHLMVDQYRAHHTEVVRPSALFDERTWREKIRAPGADELVAAILRAVGRAAAVLRVTELRKQKKLFSLSPERRQSETSTASIVRTFVWASQVLDVALPELYVYDDVPGGLAAVPGDARATAIGPAVLTGMPLQELAFVVARHLTYYRPEHYALVFYPTLPDLLSLLLSAVELGIPGMPLSSRSGASGRKLVKSLDKQLTDAEKGELARSAARFEEAGGRVDLASWIRGVELTATRAGFALSGDLAVAMRIVRRETRAIADVSVDDKRADLLAYSASEAFAKLRDELSLTAKPGAF